MGGLWWRWRLSPVSTIYFKGCCHHINALPVSLFPFPFHENVIFVLLFLFLIQQTRLQATRDGLMKAIGNTGRDEGMIVYEKEEY